MQHSLRQRFRGALLGATLGETFGISYRQVFAAQPFVPWLTLQQWGFADSAVPELYWSKIAVRQSQGFIQGGFRAESEPCAEAPPAIHPAAGAGLCVASLPITLFYHEDWHQLQDRLEQTAFQWQIPLPISSVLTIAYTISLALRERLHLDTLIPRLITDLELHDREPQLMQQLNQVQSWVQQGAGVTQTKLLLQDSSTDPIASTLVAVALYGFLSAPADFQLSLLRTAQMRLHPQESCAIVATLSGAYNGIAGIPLAWRRAFNSTPSLPSRLAPLSSEADLLQQADLLWARWSGADNPTDWLQHSMHPTIASPHLIRPR